MLKILIPRVMPTQGIAAMSRGDHRQAGGV